MFCAIWYHVYNFKNMKNTRGGVFLANGTKLRKRHYLSRLWIGHKWFEEGMGHASP